MNRTVPPNGRHESLSKKGDRYQHWQIHDRATTFNRSSWLIRASISWMLADMTLSTSPNWSQSSHKLLTTWKVSSKMPAFLKHFWTISGLTASQAWMVPLYIIYFSAYVRQRQRIQRRGKITKNAIFKFAWFLSHWKDSRTSDLTFNIKKAMRCCI